MSVTLRPARPDDAQSCGRICYDAFTTIAQQHNYPIDFPSPEAAVGFISMVIGHPGFYGVVAERDGIVIGSNFLDERSVISGVGPITVDPAAQDRGVGRMLMQDVLDRAQTQRAPGVRLVQTSYHTRSFSLYAGLGFEVRETLACMQGPALHLEIPGRTVRPATATDLEACNAVCRAVHGHDRSGEVHDAITAGTATVVEHDGRITGYATDLALFAHAVGRTDSDLQALIGAAAAFGGPGILVPSRSPLLRWCLDRKLRVIQLMTLMSVGLYSEPRGAYLPSILF